MTHKFEEKKLYGRKPKSKLTGEELRRRYMNRRARMREDLDKVEERDPRVAKAGRSMLFPEEV